MFNEKNNLQQHYSGNATLHLATGLLVLPGMSDPNDPVWEYAIIENNQHNTVQNVPIADAVAINTSTPLENIVNEKSNANIPTVQAQAVPFQAQAQTQNEIPIVQATMTTPIVTNIDSNTNTESVAYGFQDPAIQNRNRHPNDHGRINLLDPRSYF